MPSIFYSEVRIAGCKSQFDLKPSLFLSNQRPDFNVKVTFIIFFIHAIIPMKGEKVDLVLFKCFYCC